MSEPLLMMLIFEVCVQCIVALVLYPIDCRRRQAISADIYGVMVDHHIDFIDKYRVLHKPFNKFVMTLLSEHTCQRL